jgi:hypothetical protein
MKKNTLEDSERQPPEGRVHLSLGQGGRPTPQGAHPRQGPIRAELVGRPSAVIEDQS